MLLIGESINGTRKTVGEAIVNRDELFLANLARTQIDSGSTMLDINAGVGQGRDESKDLVWLVEFIQDNFDIPLCIDSSSSDAIADSLKVCHGVPMINSVSGESAKLKTLLPVVTSQRCKVVALCTDDKGIPETAEERLCVASYVVSELKQAGVKQEDIYVDPVVLSVSTDSGAGLVTLDTMTLVKKELGVNTILAVSNVGFGLPVRSLLNSAFIVFAIERGLDALLADIRDKNMVAMVKAARALLNKDPFCGEYIKAFREGQLK